MGASLDELRLGHYVKHGYNYWGIGMIPFSLHSTPREMDGLDDPATILCVDGKLVGAHRRRQRVVSNGNGGKVYHFMDLHRPIELI